MGTYIALQFGMLLAALTGVFVTFALGKHVNSLVERIRAAVPTDAPSGVAQDDWNQVTVTDPGPGQWLGSLERLLFFASIWFNAWEVVAGWLLFKVASKWEVWNNIVKVPESLGPDTDGLSQLRARHGWGTRVLQSFLAGTLANILTGVVAAVAAKFFAGAWVILCH